MKKLKKRNYEPMKFITDSIYEHNRKSIHHL